MVERYAYDATAGAELEDVEVWTVEELLQGWESREVCRGGEKWYRRDV